MKLNKTQVISLKIVLLFTVAILSTFIPDNFHSFFGDWKCEGSRIIKLIPETGVSYAHYEYTGCDYSYGAHNPVIHWGYRHWLYLVMCLTLFIIQVVDIINKATD